MSDRSKTGLAAQNFRIGKAAGALALACALGFMAPQDARADGRWDPGAAAVVGVIGGLALGSALAGGGGSVNYNYGYGGPGYGGWHHHPRYRPPVSYYWGAPPPSCYVVNERVWVEGWGWDVRPVRYCE